MGLNIGSISIPINAATKTFAILAKRGAGKTYTGGVMAEEFFKNNIPFIVFDPIDVWWGLRLNSDSRSQGLPVVVFGVENADIKLDRDMGRRIAQSVVKDNVSCVISTFGLPKVAQRHLVAEFADEILTINNSPRHIFLEEAHEYVPQRVHGSMGKTFNSVSNLVVMGRNRGIGVTLLNQRAATVNKDVLTQLDTLIAMRSVGPQDRKSLKEWVEAHAAEGDFDSFIKSLPSLPTGEGWIWSPEFLDIFKRIKIRQRQTFHPDREKLGTKFEMPDLDRVDVQSFIERFNSSVETKTEKKSEKKSRTVQDKPLYDDNYIRDLRNEYESKLITIESENRSLKQQINNIRRIVGVNGDPVINEQSIPGNSDIINMWHSKLGNSGASRIFKFLADNRGRKFTRTQIGLAVGLKCTSGSFNTYMSKLRTNKLIIKDGTEYKLNPDL
jgi:hypothetical protein